MEPIKEHQAGNNIQISYIEKDSSESKNTSLGGKNGKFIMGYNVIWF